MGDRQVTQDSQRREGKHKAGGQHFFNASLQGYQLKAGDYLKLGRVRFRIKELQPLEQDLPSVSMGGKHRCLADWLLTLSLIAQAELQGQPPKAGNIHFNSNIRLMNLDDLAPPPPPAFNEDGDNAIFEKPSTSATAAAVDDESIACRICLGDTEEEDNPFITPCKCDGTMKSIHVKCLQQWLKSRLHPKETAYSISFVWKAFDCELCKHPFPSKKRIEGRESASHPIA